MNTTKALLMSLKGKLKKGDEVRKVNSSSCMQLDDGDWHKVTAISSKSVSFNGCKHDWEDLEDEKIEVKRIIKGGKNPKPKPVNFLLKYDLDEDRIKELVAEEDSLQRDSIVVYEVKSIKRATVETKVTFK